MRIGICSCASVSFQSSMLMSTTTVALSGQRPGSCFCTTAFASHRLQYLLFWKNYLNFHNSDRKSGSRLKLSAPKITARLLLRTARTRRGQTYDACALISDSTEGYSLMLPLCLVAHSSNSGDTETHVFHASCMT
jgi:hypothetical protein